jgi:hypothetical protein
MDPTGGITLEAWIYPEDLTTVAYQEIFRKESGTGRQLFSFQINGTIISFGTDTTGNGYDELDIAITPSTYINRWCHFVATYTSGYKAIYIDGQLLGSNTGVTGNLIQGNANYFIGSTAGGSEFFNGYYASFKMYSKGLSATEVQQNYQATKDKFLGQNIATNGLVLNLDAANKDSYPGTGTTWTNLSGGGYNGTLINGPIFLSNQNGGIFSFDGVDDYIQYASLLNVGNTFTINCWIKPTVNTRQTIVSNGYPYSTNKGFFMTCPGNNPTDLFISLGQDQKLAVSGTGMITTGAWQMVTARVNGASELIKLYVNGVETTYSSQTDANITLQYDTGVFTTGCRNGVAADDRLYSNFATLQIYNRALSATEIQQNYNAQKIRFGL